MREVLTLSDIYALLDIYALSCMTCRTYQINAYLYQPAFNKNV